MLGETKIAFSIKQQKNKDIWEKIKAKYISTFVSIKNMTVLRYN